MIEIEIIPYVDRSRGCHIDRFEARHGARLLCISRVPLFAAARVLEAEGVPPDTMIMLRHAETGTPSLRTTVGYAAQLTVMETAGRGAPRIRRANPPQRRRPQRVAAE